MCATRHSQVMGKAGRKSGFNEKVKETILRLIRDGRTEDEISDIVGICRRTLNNWKGQHQDLAVAVREARLVADDLVEASLYRRALGYSHPEAKFFMHEGCILKEDTVKHYPPDTQAAQFWLRNRQPKKWKEKTEGDVNVNNSVSVNNLTDEQLDAKILALMPKEKE